jgi:dCMP deaminase
VRPTRDEVLMAHARVAALRSTCSRQSVGVIIARDGRVLVTGYNGAPAKMPHCDHACSCSSHYRENVTVKVPEHQSTCLSDKPCEISVHAEANAIAYAARWGVRTEDSDLFTTHTPCLPCGQLVINSGIKRVVYGDLHRDRRGLELCQKAGIEVVHLEKQVAI